MVPEVGWAHQLRNQMCAFCQQLRRDNASRYRDVTTNEISHKELDLPARTPRMEQIEALLADDPTDPFLRYGLAMEYVSAGDDATGAVHLVQLADEHAYVPAFLQAGQVLARLNRFEEACNMLRRGVAAARQQGDAHAEGEMAGLLSSLE